MLKKTNEQNEIEYDENTYNDYVEEQNNYDEMSLNSSNQPNNTETPLVNQNIETIPKIPVIKKISKFITVMLFLLILGLLALSFISMKADDTQYIKLNLTSIGLVKNRLNTDSYQINYLIIPETNKIPKFKVNNPEIIKINESTGYITSLKVGEVEVQLLDINNNESKKNTLKVYVVDHEIPLENFYVNDINVQVNQIDMITLSPYPSNATDINFTYKSSHPEIVSVDGKGIIKGLKTGTARITIQSNKITKTIEVNVK